MSATGYEPYRDRTLGTDGIVEHEGYRLRRHRVVYGDTPLDERRFEPGLRHALESLPRPAVTDGRPGVGFVIAHQGATGDYLIVCWWDNENELPTRIWVRKGADWRPANASESFCVWDLEILWRERQRYVETVLGGPDAGGVEAYLADPA